MSVSRERLSQYVDMLLSDEECLMELAMRLSLRYWEAFRKEPQYERRLLIASRQDVLEDFLAEIKGLAMEQQNLKNENSNKGH